MRLAGWLLVVCLLVGFLCRRMVVRVERCKSRRCLTCPDLVQDTTFVPSSTGRSYTGEYNFSNNEEEVLTCTTTNCIYLLTCKSCSYQYTGETVQQLRNRMSGHRSAVDNDSSCFRVKEHFSLACHQGFNIHIIGKLAGNGRTNVVAGKNFKIDSEVTVQRRSMETLWIRKLQTCYPYGMNVKLDNTPLKSKLNTTFGLMVSTKQNRKRSWSQRTSVREESYLKSLVNQISAFFKLPFQSRFFVAMKKVLFPLNKKELFWVRTRVMERLAEEYDAGVLENKPLYIALLDLLQFKLDPVVKKEDKVKKRCGIVCPITFINKGVEMLHITSIFRNSKDMVSGCKFKVPDVAYTYGKTIGPKLFNFKQTVMNYDPSKTLSEQYNCVCQQNSSFVDASCGHVATGNLAIIQNSRLKELILKGPGYREPSSVSPDSLYNSIRSDLKSFVKKWSEKEKLAPQVFDGWFHTVMAKVRDRINDLSARYRFPKYCSVFDDSAAARCLEELRDNFVLVPVDKAAKNVAVICKQFYMKVLLDEMESNSETYIRRQEDYSDLSGIHQEYLRSLNLPPQCDKLPYTYWTPKFHKPTLSQRFIVSYADCAIKPLAQKLSLAFRTILKQIESFGAMLHKVTGVKHCWIINNSLPIVDFLDKINERVAGRNITTYDFATLYTKLAHGDIVDSMDYVIDLAFKKSKHKYISVYDKSSSWSDKPRPGTCKFDALSLKQSLRFILEHSYFAVGSVCYQQCIGIPIGIDCAPAIANLTLFRYEYEYISKLVRSNYRRALKFNGTFRLMDDISSVNSDGAFQEDIPLIYPSSLELKKENEGTLSANILDLTVELEYSGFSYKLYDKRDKFPFEIVNYPDLGGNIAKVCGHGVVKSELQRYSKLSSKFCYYLDRKKVLFCKVLKKGYSLLKIEQIFDSIKFN